MSFDPTLLERHLEPIRPFLDADSVTELVVNRPGEIATEGPTGWQWHEVPELTAGWLARIGNLTANFTRQTLSAEMPLCSTSLPSGERVQIVAPPAVEEGQYSITIRKPSTRQFSLEDLAAYGLFSSTRASASMKAPVNEELKRLHLSGAWPEFLELAVRERKNILISGATGSAKTTLAKALIALIPREERLITIEDTRELVMPHRNCVHTIYAKDGQGQARVTAKGLLEASLRMRPDRILLQELRDGTAFFYLRNVNSGHPGSITTVHANSAALAIEQLTLLVKESEGGRDLERSEIRAMLRLLVDVVVQCKKENGRFQVTEIWFDPDVVDF